MTTHHAWGVALLRIMLGTIFFMHGVAAWTDLGRPAIMEAITRFGNPAGLAEPLSWYLLAARIGGGLLLVVGLWTRVAALAQVPITASALFFVRWPEGFFMRGAVVDAAKGRAVAAGYEYTLLVLVATFAIAMLGAGAFSIGGISRIRRQRRIP